MCSILRRRHNIIQKIDHSQNKNKKSYFQRSENATVAKVVFRKMRILF